MYTPKANAEDDLPTLREFIRCNSLCALVTTTEQGLVASHIPMVFHREEIGFGVLRGHVARANTQWHDFTPSVEALAIFPGPGLPLNAFLFPR